MFSWGGGDRKRLRVYHAESYLPCSYMRLAPRSQLERQMRCSVSQPAQPAWPFWNLTQSHGGPSASVFQNRFSLFVLPYYTHYGCLTLKRSIKTYITHRSLKSISQPPLPLSVTFSLISFFFSFFLSFTCFKFKEQNCSQHSSDFP